jgi:hypothetical protein
LNYYHHHHYQIKEDEMNMACSTHRIYENAYRILVRESEGKRPLRRPRRRWDNIKTDLKAIGYESVERIHMVQDRDGKRSLVNMVMNILVPQKTRDFFTI